MKPSVTKRWIVVGTAAALGVGAVSAPAVALNDRAPADRTAAAVTLSEPPAGEVPNGAAVADASPESADSPERVCRRHRRLGRVRGLACAGAAARVRGHRQPHEPGQRRQRGLGHLGRQRRLSHARTTVTLVADASDSTSSPTPAPTPTVDDSPESADSPN